MATYALIDVSHKQEYIYRNNKLKNNLYNSFTIKSLTEELKLDSGTEKILTLSGHLEVEHKEQFSFVYSGGGNSIIRFESLQRAQKFVKGYSREVIKAFPTLEMYISFVDETKIVESNSKEREIRELLYKKIDELKDKRRARFKRWTYGVEKIDETGQAKPSIKIDPDFELSRKYLQQRFKDVFIEKGIESLITITDDLNDYKKENDGKSYIGVIVIDGNKMGEMFKRVNNFEELKQFSDTIDSIYFDAVIEALEAKGRSTYFTPIVSAGDDLCLIIEADYAIEVAAEIVKQIEKLSSNNQHKQILNKYMNGKESSLKACTGVAIVKYSYPFFEAVKIAEGLCHHAKETIYKIGSEEANGSFIDWEIVNGQVPVIGEYENYVKHRNYNERFHIKPLRIDQTTPIENGLYSYGSFIDLAEKIGHEKDISNTVLKEIKKMTYSGWEHNKLFFEMKQTEGILKINEIIGKVLKDDPTGNSIVLQEANDQSIVYTYVLNDVLDALPFINKYREVKANVDKR